MSNLDPRWEWIEIMTWSGRQHWIKGECNHLEVEPVRTKGALGADAETVAHLCRTCDRQLPKEWTP